VHNFTVLIPIGVIVAYTVVSILAVRHVWKQGVDWRSRLREVLSLGPGGLLKLTYRGFLFLLAGLVVLSLGATSYSKHLTYQAARACDLAHTAECRDLRHLQVSGVHVTHARSGDETTVDFAGGYGSATFYSDEVPPSSLEAGGPVTAEVWRGDVTAVVIGGRKHESFASQGDAWIGIVIGAAMLLLGLSWLVADVAVASMDPNVDRSHDRFVAPFKRRLSLYVLLPVFGASLGALALGFVALVLGSMATANLLAGIYFVGGILTLPVLILVFVGWFVRAYLNVGALGLRIRHSAWFVAAALLVPPLNLYMPYRLIQEVVAKTGAPVTPALLKNWWAFTLAWAALTILGVATSTSETTTPQALLEEAALGLSIAAGLAAVVFTIRLIRAVDATELALSHRHGHGMR
jgi:Domain of unknown function (DUF4328)